MLRPLNNYNSTTDGTAIGNFLSGGGTVPTQAKAIGMDPFITGALISSGAQLLGGLFGGMGDEGRSKTEIAAQERISRMQNALGNRNASLSGIDKLMQMQALQMQQNRSRMFRNDVLSSLRGS